MERRYKRIPISRYMLRKGMMSQLGLIALMRKLPVDAKIVHFEVDPEHGRDACNIYVHSEEFPILEAGSITPELHLSIRQEDVEDAVNISQEELSKMNIKPKSHDRGYDRPKSSGLACDCVRRAGGYAYHGGHWPECKLNK